MKKLSASAIFCLISFIASAQFVYKLKGDSILISNDTCNAELIIENSTRNVCGFLFNKGEGRTEFRSALIKLNDSTYVVGCDTLKIKSGSTSPVNIYNSDGTQTDAYRTYNGNAGSLYLDHLQDLQIYSNGFSVSDYATSAQRIAFGGTGQLYLNAPNNNYIGIDNEFININSVNSKYIQLSQLETGGGGYAYIKLDNGAYDISASTPNLVSGIFHDDANKSLGLSSTHKLRIMPTDSLLIDNLTNYSLQDRILGQNGSSGRIGYINIGSGLSLSSGTLSATGGSGLITANNGLTDSSGRVILGGSLYKNTTINTGTYLTTLQGTANGAILYVNNTSGATGGYFQANQGTSVIGEGGYYGGNFSGSISGVSGSSSGYENALPLIGAFDAPSTNSIKNVLTLIRNTTGTSATGIGAGIRFSSESSDNSQINIGNLDFDITSNNLYNTSTSRFSVKALNNAAYNNVLEISGSGATKLNKYGVGAFTGTSAYILAVDATGNIIETTGGGGGSITADNGLTANTSTNVQLFGSVGTPATLLSDRYLTAADKTLNITFNSLAGNSGLNISSTSTAAASNAQKGLNVSLSGTNVTTDQITYSVFSQNTHGGTNAVNYAGFFSASGGTQNTGVYGDGGTYGLWGNSTGTGVNGVGQFGVSGTGTTYGGLFSGTSTAGVAGISNGSFAGVYGQTATGRAGLFNVIESAATTGVYNAVEIWHQTSASGSMTSGFGSAITFSANVNGGVGSIYNANQVISKWTDATLATRTSQFIISGVNSATTQNIMSIAGNGQLTLDQYTTSNFNGGSANDSVLVITSAGVVKKRNASAFGGGGSGMSNPMTTLGDIIYENSTPAAARLAGNTTTNKRFLSQKGTGSVSATPTWDAILENNAASIDPANLTANSGETHTLTVTGAALGDYVQASFSIDLQGMTITAWVSAVNTVSYRFVNTSGATLNLGSGTVKVRVWPQ